MSSRILLLLILGLAGFLRFYDLGSFGPYIDEKYTLLNVHGICVGGYNQPELTDNDTFTPKEFWKKRDLQDHYEAIARSDFGTHFTYNVFLKYWIKAFGLDDFSVRTLGVLLNLLTLVLVFWFCSTLLKSKKTGLIASAFLAIDPLFVSQSHYSRSYTLSFLLVVLGSMVFYKILQSDKKSQTLKLAILYAVIATMALLNHYLNFIIFLSHAFIAILFLRESRKWIGLLAAGAFTILIMAYWTTKGGGQWSMQFLKDKNALHLSLAKMSTDENPMSGLVDPSTFKNVAQKTTSVFLNSNVLSFQLYHSLLGIKNLLLLLSGSLLLLFASVFTKITKGKILITGAILFLLLGIFLLPGIYKIAFLSGGIMLLSLHQFFTSQTEKRMKWALSLAAILPVLYVLFDAIKSGHTTSLAARYIGVCVPFLAIIYAIGLVQFLKHEGKIKFLILIPIAFQVYITSLELNKILLDQSSDYSFRNIPRTENPYILASRKVIDNYASGDTLIIPSYGTNVYSEFLGDESQVVKNISDAQYLNLYLPKDATYIQKININEKNRLILKKTNGELIELFDFEGQKYRF
jgi:uncharacterized membrane protein